MKPALFRINAEDDVAVALQEIAAGETVQVAEQEFQSAEAIPFGHKMALREIRQGAMVRKYGYSIGKAAKDIRPGEWVHSHNLKTGLNGKIEYIYQPAAPNSPDVKEVRKTFDGYRRANGSIGVRNEIWIIPTVSCVNHTANELAELATRQHPELEDGVLALPHNSGCSQLGDDERTTQEILASLVHHPNAGGVLLIGLGCENNNMEAFLPFLGDYDKSRIKTMITQEVGDELETGLSLIDQIAQVMAQDKREPVDASELRIGMKCGGSDAFSGVTANPLCGRISERVCALGGTSILTEVPEMFGAETSLMNRAQDSQTFEKVVTLINGFKQYYIDYNQPIYENPSPGNKAGGITTLEEKSLGCIQKGGKAAVTDTLAYGEQSKTAGLNLGIGPGNDSVSITNLVANGAQLILFTTGRGNPLGTVVPCLKISSNSQLYERKPQWIDFNAGQHLEGKTMDALQDELWDLVLEVASGRKKARNEVNGFREIMIFKNGVML